MAQEKKLVRQNSIKEALFRAAHPGLESLPKGGLGLFGYRHRFSTTAEDRHSFVLGVGR